MINLILGTISVATSLMFITLGLIGFLYCIDVYHTNDPGKIVVGLVLTGCVMALSLMAWISI